MGIVFGGLVALDDVNMTVEKGQIRGLIGQSRFEGDKEVSSGT